MHTSQGLPWAGSWVVSCGHKGFRPTTECPADREVKGTLDRCVRAKGDPNQLFLEVDGIVCSSSLWAGAFPRFIVSKQIRGVSTADVFSSTRL